MGEAPLAALSGQTDVEVEVIVDLRFGAKGGNVAVGEVIEAALGHPGECLEAGQVAAILG